jgi:acyl-homoserine lactone acylase PvdQ
LRIASLAALIAGLFLLSYGASETSSQTAPDGHYQEFGDAGGFLNILPPGQDGVLNGPEAIAAQGGVYPPHVTDQLPMYGDLVYSTPGLDESRLQEFFKEASFGVHPDDIDRVYSPTSDVVVIRDLSFGVPHIFGDTRYATMFAQGYTAAEDRLFLMDILRHLGRARLSEFLGASEANQEFDRDQLAVAPYQESDLTAQIQAIQDSGAEGQAGHEDLLAYVDGVNAYIDEATADPQKLPAEYPALQQTPETWIPEDTVAIASLVGGIFGKGGGGELTNFCGLKSLTAATGDSAAARAIFDDFHFANDPEAPTTSQTSTPYLQDLGPVNPVAHPDIDCDSLTTVDTGAPSLQALLDAIAERFPGFVSSQSNAVLVSGQHTESGSPIAVFGPQTAYFMPQLLLEKDVHGPGIDARGVSFAGTDLYVQLGRGTNYAWSATSAGADNIDQWVLRLCEPGGGAPSTTSMGYERNSVCEPIEEWDHTQIAKPSGGGIPPVCPPEAQPDCNPVVLNTHLERSAHYGPIVARGTLEDGTPIAIATQRSTYQHELDSARGFRRVNDPANMTNGYQSFRETMGGGVDYTFNWFYIDESNIGYQHSCKCPQRAQGVDPYLPAWGDGAWDWQGFIPLSAQPSALNPPSGWLISWNNKQAPDFTSNDREFYYGSTYRSELLQTRLEAAIAAGPLDRADVVDVMEDAGTADLRGQEDLPLLLDVLGPTAPPGADARAQDMRDRLAAWDAHRRDHDNNGSYDNPQAPAIIDAWWPRLLHAEFDASSANAIDLLHLTLEDPNLAIHRGSAFQDGLYGHVNKDLRQVLGQAVTGPMSQTYCGGGDLGACRAALWDSLSQAAVDLEAEFSNASVASWQRSMSDDAVVHSEAGVTGVDAIHWINRPTFQQVVQIGADTDGDGCTDAQENGLDEALGGRRNYLNEWDFYDIDGNELIDLFNDIFAVAEGFGQVPGDGGYSTALDRSAAPPGADVWDMGPPNGTIDLFVDIFGVAYQFGHRCD